jgi:hypothetical protein
MYNIACAYSRRGNRDQAIRWLEKAAAGGFRRLDLVEGDPDLDPLRGDLRFQDLLARWRLVQEHQRWRSRPAIPDAMVLDMAPEVVDRRLRSFPGTWDQRSRPGPPPNLAIGAAPG